MPGPVMKSRQFPGVDQLPQLAQTLIEMVYPPDEVMPTAGMALQPGSLLERIAASKVAGKARMAEPSFGTATGVVEPMAPEVLAPLPHIIDKVKAAAPKVMEELTWQRGTPEGFITAHPAVQEMVQLLRKAPDFLSPDKVALGSRVTSKRPPSPTRLTAPKGWDFKYDAKSPSRRSVSGGRPQMDMKRDPLVREMSLRYRDFDRTQRNLSRTPK